MQALEPLAKNQQVEYDFGVYTLPMPTDVPVTILSDGPSLLKASVSLEMPLNAGAAGDCITSAATQHCSAANTLEVVGLTACTSWQYSETKLHCYPAANSLKV